MIKTDDHELNELYSDISRSHPNLAEMAFEDWAKKNPQMVKAYLLEKKCGKHINKYSARDSLHAISKVLNTSIQKKNVSE